MGAGLNVWVVCPASRFDCFFRREAVSLGHARRTQCVLHLSCVRVCLSGTWLTALCSLLPKRIQKKLRFALLCFAFLFVCFFSLSFSRWCPVPLTTLGERDCDVPDRLEGRRAALLQPMCHRITLRTGSRRVYKKPERLPYITYLFLELGSSTTVV